MKSYEAIQKAVAGKSVEFAKRLGISTVLLHKWQEPSTDFSDSGAYNPLDRIETIVETALARGHEEAMAPIEYLCKQFNIIPIKIEKQHNTSSANIAKELARTLRDFSSFTEEVAEALEDGSISKVEANKIDTEVWQLIRHLALFNEIVKKASR